MTAAMPLFVAPYRTRQAARAELRSLAALVSDAIVVAAWREELALAAIHERAATHEIRRARAAVELARADADEAEALYHRALGDYARAHVRCHEAQARMAR